MDDCNNATIAFPCFINVDKLSSPLLSLVNLDSFELGVVSESLFATVIEFPLSDSSIVGWKIESISVCILYRNNIQQ